MARAGAGAGPARRGRAGRRREVELLLALADALRDPAGRRGPGDAGLPAGAGRRRALHGGDRRAGAAVPAHPGLGPPGRGADKKAHTVDDGELAVKLRLQVGELWEERLGDNERAVEAFKEVLTVDPQNLQALKALERLYEKTGQDGGLPRRPRAPARGHRPDEERVALYNRMAEVWEQQFGKPDRAIDAWRRSC